MIHGLEHEGEAEPRQQTRRRPTGGPEPEQVGSAMEMVHGRQQQVLLGVTIFPMEPRW